MVLEFDHMWHKVSIFKEESFFKYIKNRNPSKITCYIVIIIVIGISGLIYGEQVDIILSKNQALQI